MNDSFAWVARHLQPTNGGPRASPIAKAAHLAIAMQRSRSGVVLIACSEAFAGLYKQEASKIVARPLVQTVDPAARRVQDCAYVDRRRQCESRDEFAKSIEEWEAMA
jgi:hypothetical protein